MRRAPIFALVAVALLAAGCDNLFQEEEGTRDEGPPAIPGTYGDTEGFLPSFSSVTPNDSLLSDQWGVTAVSAPAAWGVLSDTSLSGEFDTVTVAVLDSMIDLDHPDLRGRIGEGGWDFIDDRPIADSVGLVEPDEHGTHVAGIIAAGFNNGIGVAGVGKNLVEILPIRILDNNQSGSEADLLIGLLYAAGLADGDPPPKTASVINMSLGTRSRLSGLLESVLTDLTNAGITLVAASGNFNDATLDYPAAYPSVISVGSVDYTGGEYVRSGFVETLSSGSTYGSGLDVMAPGGVSDQTNSGILSTLPTSTDETVAPYGYEQGTSMSVPFVAGIAALLYSWDAEIKPWEIRAILSETATDIGAAGRDNETGWGLVNADRAIRRRLMEPYGPYSLESTVITYRSALSAPVVEDRQYRTPRNLEPILAPAESTIADSGDHLPGSYLLATNRRRSRLLGDEGTLKALAQILPTAGGKVVRRLSPAYFQISVDMADPAEVKATLEEWELIERVEPNRRILFSRGVVSRTGEGGVGSPTERVVATGELPAVTEIGSGSRSGIRESSHLVLDGIQDLGRLPEGTAGALESEVRSALDRYDRVVLVTIGIRPTGGYSVELESANRRDGLLELIYTVGEPDPGALVSQALTTPYLLLGLRDRDELIVRSKN